MQNPAIQITDEEFLRGIFGDHWYRAAMVSSRQVDGFAQHYWQEVQEGVYPWRKDDPETAKLVNRLVEWEGKNG